MERLRDVRKLLGLLRLALLFLLLGSCTASPEPPDGAGTEELVLGFRPPAVPIPGDPITTQPAPSEISSESGPAVPPPETEPGTVPKTPEIAVNAEILVSAHRDVRTIPRALYGTNIEWPYEGWLAWDTARDAPHATILALTRDAGVTLFRFPGGVFSDYYHWLDGVGPAALRPTTKMLPPGPASKHAFGTDEAIRFAEACGGRLLITVNAGTGTADEAADWVWYVNARYPAGHPRHITDWEVGNELYVNDGSPTSAPITIPPGEYAARYLQFARAMRAADPSIRVGAIGGENQGSYAVISYPGWNETLLAAAGDEIDYLAVHNAYAPALFVDRGEDVRTVYASMLAAPLHIRDNLEALSRNLDAFVVGGRRVPIAITEWGPLFTGETGSRYVDHVKTLGSALYVASALKVFIESPRVESAAAFKLVDIAFMGWIGLRNGVHTAKAPLLALQMYARHFGDVLVESSTISPTYASRTVGFIDARSDVPYLEAICSRSSDRRRLYVMVINKHFDAPLRGRIEIEGFTGSGQVQAWTLAGTGIDANTGTELPQLPELSWGAQASDGVNPRFYAGGPGEVAITVRTLDGVENPLVHEFPARSVTCLEISAAVP